MISSSFHSVRYGTRHPKRSFDIESIEEVDEDAASEGDDQDERGDERGYKPDEANDDLDLFREPDESSTATTHEEPEISNRPDIEQDPDISSAESLCTIPWRRYERRAGYKIIRECCPLVVEIPR
ncbi:hypothetical protein BYT27DRAFT_6666442 [Phlegmacium glaucopus]|nr:hypothetical protein BYT27DRAFT_6666442 [Phlegmacium glaucopus]